MKTTLKAAAVLSVTLALLAPASLFAMAKGDRGEKVRVAAVVDRDPVNPESVKLPVMIDVSKFQIDGNSVRLGGYVVRVEFDPGSVELLRVGGGSGDVFKADPVATDVVRANELGAVQFTSYDLKGGAGSVNVANVVFREKVPGGADALRVKLLSAASTLQDSSGKAIHDLELPVEGGK